MNTLECSQRTSPAGTGGSQNQSKIRVPSSLRVSKKKSFGVSQKYSTAVGVFLVRKLPVTVPVDMHVQLHSMRGDTMKCFLSLKFWVSCICAVQGLVHRLHGAAPDEKKYLPERFVLFGIDCKI